MSVYILMMTGNLPLNEAIYFIIIKLILTCSKPLQLPREAVASGWTKRQWVPTKAYTCLERAFKYTELLRNNVRSHMFPDLTTDFHNRSPCFRSPCFTLYNSLALGSWSLQPSFPPKKLVNKGPLTRKPWILIQEEQDSILANRAWTWIKSLILWKIIEIHKSLSHENKNYTQILI